MAQTAEQMIAAQLGGLTLELIKRDAQIEQLVEENQKLRDVLQGLAEKDEKVTT